MTDLKVKVEDLHNPMLQEAIRNLSLNMNLSFEEKTAVIDLEERISKKFQETFRDTVSPMEKEQALVKELKELENDSDIKARAKKTKKEKLTAKIEKLRLEVSHKLGAIHSLGEFTPIMVGAHNHDTFSAHDMVFLKKIGVVELEEAKGKKKNGKAKLKSV